jgi:hypothetical protein
VSTTSQGRASRPELPPVVRHGRRRGPRGARRIREPWLVAQQLAGDDDGVGPGTRQVERKGVGQALGGVLVDAQRAARQARHGGHVQHPLARLEAGAIQLLGEARNSRRHRLHGAQVEVRVVHGWGSRSDDVRDEVAHAQRALGVRDDVHAQVDLAVVAPSVPGQRAQRLEATLLRVGVKRGEHAAVAALHAAEGQATRAKLRHAVLGVGRTLEGDVRTEAAHVQAHARARLEVSHAAVPHEQHGIRVGEAHAVEGLTEARVHHALAVLGERHQAHVGQLQHLAEEVRALAVRNAAERVAPDLHGACGPPRRREVEGHEELALGRQGPHASGLEARAHPTQARVGALRQELPVAIHHHEPAIVTKPSARDLGGWGGSRRHTT